MTLRALIFDVDGTLADTEDAHRVAFNAAFQAHHLSWTWSAPLYRDLLKVAGGKERIGHFIETLMLPVDEAARLQNQITTLHQTKTSLYTQSVASGKVALRPGVARLMRAARNAGLLLAIATTTTPENVHALLRGTLGAGAASWFTAIAAGDIVASKKPAPDIYLVTLDRLGCRAGECIAFEDSTHGLQAAKSAGLTTVVTPTQWSAADDFAQADLVLPMLGDPAHPLTGPARARLAARWLELGHLESLLLGREQEAQSGSHA